MHPSLYNIFPPSFIVGPTVTNFQPPTFLYPSESSNPRDTDEILKLLKSPQHHQSDSGTNKKASKQTSVRNKKIYTAKRRIVWNSHLSENKWIPILFKPPAYMDLDDLDIKMATYVFAPNKRSDEYLVTTNKFSGTRDNFKSLIPKERVHGD
ncbi:hypothetical protein S245_024776, partial [Arachis hypogaea]